MNSESILQVLQQAWFTVQPAISGVFGAVVTTLFLRKNIKTEELERIKQSKFSEVAEALLEGGHITYREYNKCKNFNKIAEKADEIYLQNKLENVNETQNDTENKTIDIDWFVRFFEDCSNISNEQFQELWAKILAGEVAKPGSFSLRTLETLKNMNQEEARFLEKIAPYVFYRPDDAFLYFDISPFDFNSDLTNVLYLNEIGVTNSVDMLQRTLSYSTKYVRVFYNNNFIIHAKGKEKQEMIVKFTAIPFNSVGIQLFTAINAKPNNAHFVEVVKDLTAKNAQITFLTCYNKEDNGIYPFVTLEEILKS